jgi:hypothetical protein
LRQCRRRGGCMSLQAQGAGLGVIEMQPRDAEDSGFILSLTGKVPTAREL